MTEGIRLPTYTIPQNYVIHLTPFIIENNFTIEGHVDIEVDILKDANDITLHINGIEIYENMVEVLDETRYGLLIRYPIITFFFVTNENLITIPKFL